MMQTLNTPPRQVLLRLPEDLAAKLARAVGPRQRNRFLVDLLAKGLAEQEEARHQVLIDAAKRMNELEAKHPELLQEAREWETAELTDPVDVWDADFDREMFERDLAEAQKTRNQSALPAKR